MNLKNMSCIDEFEPFENGMLVWSTLTRPDDGEALSASIVESDGNLYITDAGQTLFHMMSMGTYPDSTRLDFIERMLPEPVRLVNGEIRLDTEEDKVETDIQLHFSVQHSISLLDKSWRLGSAHHDEPNLITRIWQRISHIPHMVRNHVVTGASGHDIRFPFAHLGSRPTVIGATKPDWQSVHISFSRMYDIRESGYGRTIILDNTKDHPELDEMMTFLSEQATIIPLTRLDTLEHILTH